MDLIKDLTEKQLKAVPQVLGVIYYEKEDD